MKLFNICLLSLLCVFASCSKSPQEQIIGKWVSEDGKSSIEFMKNMDVILDGDTKTNYSVREGEILINGAAGAVLWNFKLNDQTLTLKNNQLSEKFFRK